MLQWPTPYEGVGLVEKLMVACVFNIKNVRIYETVGDYVFHRSFTESLLNRDINCYFLQELSANRANAHLI